MSLDDVLFGVIVGGVGLCAAYFREEYIGWREHRAAEMRKETSMRDLHIDRFPHRKDADSIRSIVNLENSPARRVGGTEHSVLEPIETTLGETQCEAPTDCRVPTESL
jgi:hypothetical protein